MNELDDFIFECPPDRNYWVVRASGGSFVRCFTANSIAAIGHIDELRLTKLPQLGTIDYTKYKLDLGNSIKGEVRTAASISSQINQAMRFIEEIKEDDLIITLDSSEVSIGRVTGPAYIDRLPVTYGNGPNEIKMDYSLRRPVAWGPILKRSEIPSNMDASLHAHQTVFNINNYWAAVHHLMFPFFRRGNTFYFTLNIRQKKDISNYSLGQLIVLLSEFEVIAKKGPSINEKQDFDEVLKKFRDSEKLGLSTKAEFMSPGEIWAAIDLSSLEHMAIYALAYVMLFGGEIPHVFKADGLLDTKTRAKIFELIAKRLASRDSDSIKEDLKLTKPNKDTKVLKDSSKTAKQIDK